MEETRIPSTRIDIKISVGLSYYCKLNSARSSFITEEIQYLTDDCRYWILTKSVNSFSTTLSDDHRRKYALFFYLGSDQIRGARALKNQDLLVTSPTSQLILQPFYRFTYVTAHSPTLPLLYLRHSSFSNPFFGSPTSQALHLIHLASRPWKEPLWRASIPGIYRIPSFKHSVTASHFPRDSG